MNVLGLGCLSISRFALDCNPFRSGLLHDAALGSGRFSSIRSL